MHDRRNQRVSAFVHGWDRLSALFGASPGALAQVMVLSAEYKADLRAIAIVQTLRVVALTVGIPVGASLFGLTAEGGIMARLGGWHPRSRNWPFSSRSRRYRRWWCGGCGCPAA